MRIAKSFRFKALTIAKIKWLQKNSFLIGSTETDVIEQAIDELFNENCGNPLDLKEFLKEHLPEDIKAN